MWDRLKLFLTFRDSRFEDLTKDNFRSVVYRDASAGLVTAMTAIPMAMGFAMAMGLRPEQGLIAGAMSCLIGRTFGGSKYQVYGPTAAFIPLIYAMMQKYDHGFLVAASAIAGVVLCVMGLFGMGKVAKYVPNSIIVGFTVGIGITIAATTSMTSWASPPMADPISSPNSPVWSNTPEALPCMRSFSGYSYSA